MLKRLRNFAGRMMMKLVKFAARQWARRHRFALSVLKWTLTAGSAALTVYVLDYFLPVWLTAAIASTVIVHEFGHYITARRLGRRVDPPLFLPFIWGVIGGTRIHNRGSEPEKDGQIHLAGPTWGFIWAAAGAGFAIYFGQQTIMWAFIWLAAFNLWHGTLGSDGKFYQTMKLQTFVGENTIVSHYEDVTTEEAYVPAGAPLVP